jgi:hypothetical protein
MMNPCSGSRSRLLIVIAPSETAGWHPEQLIEMKPGPGTSDGGVQPGGTARVTVPSLSSWPAAAV